MVVALNPLKSYKTTSTSLCWYQLNIHTWEVQTAIAACGPSDRNRWQKLHCKSCGPRRLIMAVTQRNFLAVVWLWSGDCKANAFALKSNIRFWSSIITWPKTGDIIESLVLPPMQIIELIRFSAFLISVLAYRWHFWFKYNVFSHMSFTVSPIYIKQNSNRSEDQTFTVTLVLWLLTCCHLCRDCW